MRSADYACRGKMYVCPSVPPSVCPSHAGIECKRLYISSTVSLTIHRALTRDIDIANLSVRLSVCVSVTFRYRVSDENNLRYRHSFSPYGSPISLVLSALNIFIKFRQGYPCGGAKYRWGINISRFSTNKLLYLANDTKYRHSYYRRQIGNRTRSFRMALISMTLSDL